MKLKEVCRDITEARYKYKVCEKCGAVIRNEHTSCPKCGLTAIKQIQPGDMEREVLR